MTEPKPTDHLAAALLAELRHQAQDGGYHAPYVDTDAAPEGSVIVDGDVDLHGLAAAALAVTPMTVPPQGHLVLELPPGIAPAAVVQALLVVQTGTGLAIVGGEMEGMVPVERRRLADLLDAAADRLVQRADELDDERAPR